MKEKDNVYDRNFKKAHPVNEEITTWYDVTDGNFEFYGIIPEENGILTRRIPQHIADTISEGIAGLNGYGAGGRVLFSTDSEFVALRVEYAVGAVPTVLNLCFSYGFDLYKYDGVKRDIYVGTGRPALGFGFEKADFLMNTRNKGKMESYTLNFPHFAQVKKLLIGVKNGSKIGKGKKYANEKPVVFYGSSVTHGAAAGRPGNTYENFISQKYNLNYINLGFAGNAKGKPAMAEYIASLDMSAFVCDYDYNAPTVEHLEATHYPFYEIIRKYHPDIPYIMISKPTCFKGEEDTANRKRVIMASYNKAVASGDKNVYFIDGETLFDGEFYESCTSDSCHPNDIGFIRMAEKIGPVVAKSMGLE